MACSKVGEPDEKLGGSEHDRNFNFFRPLFSLRRFLLLVSHWLLWHGAALFALVFH